MELQDGGEVSRSATAPDSKLTVTGFGTKASVEATATVGAGTSTLCVLTAGDSTQQVRTEVLTGALFDGQQLWLCVF